MTVLMLLASTAMAQELDGFTEVRLQGYMGVESDNPLFFVERFRPTFSASPTDRMVLSTTVEVGFHQGWTMTSAFEDLVEEKGLSPMLTESLGAESSSNSFLGISEAEDYLSVDRLYVEFLLKSMDIRVGRQALNWGSGFVVNPSDPFPEVLLTEPWKPRSGINAARLDIPFGELNSLQVVAGADDAFLHPRLASRVTVNMWETDWSVVGAWREEIDEAIVGLDIKGTLGVGFWFEGVGHIREGEDPYEEMVVGLDYSFPVFEQFMITAQYYRNGSGDSESDSTVLFDQGDSFSSMFSDTDYLMSSLAIGLTPDISMNALWLQNLGDGSAFAIPTVTTLIGQNVEVSLAAQVPLSTSEEGGEFKPAPEDLVVELPSADGSLVSTDLGAVVPDATLILWTRYNF